MKFAIHALATAFLLRGVSGFHLSMSGGDTPASQVSGEFTTSSRRNFMEEATTSFGLIASSTSVGWFGGTHVENSNHDHECTCGGCSISFGPSPASAYERRDVGGDNRSATTAALNIQAAETNARLEASGFKLDSREEEASRLSAGLASFSYDSASSGKNKSNVGRGYSPNSRSGSGDAPKRFQ